MSRHYFEQYICYGTMNMNKIKLLIADDHTILREGIVSLLQAEESFMVAGTAGNGYEVLDLVSKKDFDVCLLDISMPGLDGMETAKLVKERKPAIKIIMLTTYNDPEIISELIHIGVSGYLLKNSDKQELVEGAGNGRFGELGRVQLIQCDLSRPSRDRPEGGANYRYHKRARRLLGWSRLDGPSICLPFVVG